MNHLRLLSILIIYTFSASARDYWQQRVTYKMKIDMDVAVHQFKGTQQAVYYNNSPDTLHKIFYHLYFNAFQPGSMMDVRSRSIADPDRRIGDRISKLKDDEIGYHLITSLQQNGKAVVFEVKETILEVKLDRPLLPGDSTVLDMTFNSQVPIQVRRSGRNNSEGIDYSMSQWYPKIVEYDREGWHTTPYIAREYFGVWGDFDVTIDIDTAYTVAATGVLQNPEEIGKGYGEKTIVINDAKNHWHFTAENVHDFVWAGDPDYIHTKPQMPDGPEFHFFYQNDTAIIENWEALPAYAVKCFQIMKDLVGAYPYPVYSVIQGGDGGMEYPMATLVMGTGKKEGLIGVTVHEAIHSWFQGLLANNEGNYPWMDEGFDTYYDHIVLDSLLGDKPEFPHKGSYNSYFALIKAGTFEPLSTHSDHYNLNRAYGVASYSMGCVMLNELNYILGTETFNRAMKRYFNTWKFRHPGPTDFKRVMEKTSDMELDWFFNYFIYTTKTIDYGIKEVNKDKDSAEIILENAGTFPMPVDVIITLKEGQKMYYTIPLYSMFNAKNTENGINYNVQKSWAWTNKEYTLKVPVKRKEIKIIEIDPTQRMADINIQNNTYPEAKVVK